VLGYNDSLVTAAKMKAKFRFHMTTMLLYCTLQKTYLKIMHSFQRSITIQMF